MRYRYIIGESDNPYYNLAMEESLFQEVKEDEIILFLWKNENTIVIGRNQDPYIECRMDEFVTNGGKIARRHSGGGAVYHDKGNLNYSIISTLENSKKCKYQDLLSNALLLCGVNIEFNGRNDLVIQNKKISGNAFYTNGQMMCQHGTVLVDVDIDKMTYYLTPDSEKLERNCVRSVKSRVINLTEINHELTIEKIKNALIQSVDAEPMLYYPNENELEKLAKIYASEEWILRRNFK